ncbi:Mut7-C RNAse domain-containing protein [bacterium]|nr:Mut7-C RNAse domain-containing protein [bacterium]
MIGLMLDGMLVGLARRLRLMGYDCALPRPGEAGPAIAWRARAEGRVLVTVSRTQLERPPVEVFLVPEDDLTAQVRAIVRRFPIDVERLAFTRCSRDNTPLKTIPLNEVITRIPPRARELITEVRRCPQCGRLYWDGTHVERMRKRMREYTE